MKLSDVTLIPRTIKADEVEDLLQRIKSILAGHPELAWQVEDEFARFFCVRKLSKRTWERIDTAARMLNEGKEWNEIKEYFDDADPNGNAPGESIVNSLQGRYKTELFFRRLKLRRRASDLRRFHDDLRRIEELTEEDR